MKKFISIIMTIVLVFSLLSMSAFAEEPEEIPNGYIVKLPDIEEAQVGCDLGDYPHAAGTYNYVGNRSYGIGTIRYIYYVYKMSSSYYKMTGLNLSDAVYHKKGAEKITLSYTKSATYTSQTANNFSLSVGGEAGVYDMVSACVALGTGVTQTSGKEYKITSTVKYEIPASKETGYYKLHVCYNYYKTKVVQEKADGTTVATKYISMPFGESYTAVLYSTTTASGSWKKM